MTGNEIRQRFLDFFAARGHAVLPGASLIPADHSTLFTIAGMQQFSSVFKGEAPVAHRRVATCQKCLRVDDLDSVGRTASHHTLFEMLGNFSFGDYFKRETIEWGYQFVVKELGLPADRIWVSVYPDDEEALAIWRDVIGIPPERIVKLEDNWWPLAEDWVGPTGPDSEIYLDLGEGAGCGRPDCRPGCPCDRFPELWNLVFQQYSRDAGGKLSPLPAPGIDTGMGLERVTRVVQGAKSNFDTDLFRPIIQEIERIAQQRRPTFAHHQQELAVRIIADHSRAVAFLVADGVLPGNEGRGYVLRRLIRRAHRFGRELGIEQPFLYRLAPVVGRTMGQAYPEVEEKQDFAARMVHAEEERFQATLDQGSQLFERVVRQIKRAGGKLIPGQEAFRLYDTYGFPVELTAELAAERGLAVDETGFREAMERQRKAARAARAAGPEQTGLARFAGATVFVGYQTTEAQAQVLAIAADSELRETLKAGERGEVVLDHTPFYAEAGGQVGDTGELLAEALRARVLDTRYPVEGVIAHLVEVNKGELKTGMDLTARVDRERRLAVARAHTATHLLHWALRHLLGGHAAQAGSVVREDYLRFDFSHFEPLTPDQMEEIERLVNQRIIENRPVQTAIHGLSEAKELGATALFGEKYGEEVRVVKLSDFSMELCGGTHAHATGDIGAFLLTSEGSIGAGLRRVEALTGMASWRLARERQQLLERAAEPLRASPEELPDRVSHLLAQLREAEREISSLRARQAGPLVEELLAGAKQVGPAKLVSARVADLPADSLRDLADSLMARLGSGVVVLGTVADGKVFLVGEVSSDLTARVKAGDLVREVARITGGGGGGRADFAQAGGRHPEKMDQALARAEELVARALGDG